MTALKSKLKVVIVGEARVGKTCLIMRYSQDTFSNATDQTIGADFFSKRWGSSSMVYIWDSAGEERFTSLTSIYTRNAGAAILAYDISNRETFESLSSRFLPIIGDDCLKVVVGTKLDLIETGKKERQVQVKEAKHWAEQINESYERTNPLKRTPFFETSSLTSQHVAEMFEYAFEICLGPPTDSPLTAAYKKDSSHVNLKEDTPQTTTPKRKKCSC